MRRISFYLNYAARNLRRSARWTTFAVFCIAAVVALRSLGLAIGDSLIDNVRASNHGDITLTRNSPGNTLFPSFGRSEESAAFSQVQVDSLEARAQQYNAQLAL